MENIFFEILVASWQLLRQASVYMLFGILFAGLLKVFLSPDRVARHLGRGRFSSVFKAGLLGVPVPLCSCGVLPAGASLKKQGANTGATTAFLISTPESGVDSIAITYALMDPVMTVARPISAFGTAAVAGIAENMLDRDAGKGEGTPDLRCTVDDCCDGVDCPPEVHRAHHSFLEKLKAGLVYSLKDLWADIAPWFFVGILLAGLITALIPADLLGRHLGGGLLTMLIMLVVGIPLYICATASTPIAAALILQGVSPGAALVFLLAGPATNITSLTVLLGVLGKRATIIYVASIAVMSVLCGLALDQVYAYLGISARSVVGQAAEIVPEGVQVAGALVLGALSIGPIWHALRARLFPTGKAAQSCGCDAASPCQTEILTMKGSSCCGDDSFEKVSRL
jgi:uncharacterized membrane protein YraQ (UPF0718 family)